MSGDIALTPALRNNLLSLQNTQRLIDTTQVRLATGRKVNSALDNPLNFFRAQTFTDRANDLSQLLDGINLSIRTIEEADKGVQGIVNLLDNAEAIIDQAKSAYNGASTSVAVVAGLQTIGGAATQASTLDSLSGGITGFASSGDIMTFSIQTEGGTTTASFTGGSSIGAILFAFNGVGTTAGALGATGMAASYSATDGALSIDVTNGNLSLIENVKITITDADGDGDVSDPAVNFGGVIVRESSGTQSIYAGIQVELQNLEERYNKIRTEISAIANDSEYNGINLLKSNDLLTVFNEEGTSNLTTIGQDLTTFGLDMSFADFSTRTLLGTRDTELQNAIATVRNFGNSIATDLSIIQNRETFTRETITTLESGADDLTLADVNEEGANLLALQTRQQLGVTSLSLASDAQQSVLRLF